MSLCSHRLRNIINENIVRFKKYYLSKITNLDETIRNKIRRIIIDHVIIDKNSLPKNVREITLHKLLVQPIKKELFPQNLSSLFFSRTI